MHLFAAARSLCVLLLAGTFVSFVPKTESPTGMSPLQSSAQNHLDDATSRFLQRQADSPIDWHVWGADALELAKQNERLIFLVIGDGYSRLSSKMEREVLRNQAVVPMLGEEFVCILVDRDERPDVVECFATALQVYGRETDLPVHTQGPMWFCLTPEGHPIVGGSFFSDESTNLNVRGKSILSRIAELWRNQPKELAEQAKWLMEETQRELQPQSTPKSASLDALLMETCLHSMVEATDPLFGGIDEKFQNTDIGKSLRPEVIALFQQQANRSDRHEMNALLDLTLKQMALGGIRDHLAGGFHRGSTDREWSTPHFEKRLCDQAQMSAVYSEAYRQTTNPLYRDVACEALDFALRELLLDNGLFAASLAAEIERVNGASYRWTANKIRKVLGDHEAELFLDAYALSEPLDDAPGQILRLKQPLTEIAAEQQLDATELNDQFAMMRGKLLVARERRAHPERDNNVITAWNGLMIGALAQAGKEFQRDDYLAAAGRSAAVSLTEARDSEHRLLRTLPTEYQSQHALLVDYACLIDGLLKLYAATQDDEWRTAAIELQREQDRYFTDSLGGYFQTPSDQTDLRVRSKISQDGDLLGGNSLSIRNLLKLAQITRDARYQQQAEATLKEFADHLSDTPCKQAELAVALGDWLAYAATTEETPSSEGELVAFAKDEKSESTILLTASEEIAKEKKKKEQVQAKILLSVDKLTAGEKCEFVVILEIQEGWHINANPPSPDNMIATAVTIKSKEGTKQLEVKYPKGKKFALEDLPDPLSVYEGEVQIRGEIEAAKTAAGKKDEVEFQIRYQACNDKNCLPPKTLKLPGVLEIVAPGTPVKQINQKYFAKKPAASE